MDDGQQFTPPEAEVEKSEPRGRRGNSTLLRGCLALIVVVVVGAVALATFSLLSRDDDSQVAGGVDHEATAAAELATGEPSANPPQEPAQVESETEEAELDDSADPQGQEPVERTPSETPAPTAEPSVTPTTGPTPEPTPEPAATEPDGSDGLAKIGAGRIAFIDGRSRLWTVASDGSDRRLLSEPGRSYQFPSWSPAGNDIAVIGSDFDGGGVYVVADEQDSEIRQLYADRISLPIYLYWSPEGENVSFIANHSDGLALHLASTTGRGAPQLVATSPSTFFWDWMPDGSQVLVHTGFTARDSDDSRLAFVPLDDAREPSEIVQRGFFQAPAVAADGRYYSFSDEDPTGNRWLSVWDIDSNQQVKLIFHQGVVAMGFSPTRAQLAYTSPERPEQSFYGPLRLLDLESGESRQLIPETVLAFFWSPDGRSIAYLTLSTIEGPFEFDDAPVAGLSDHFLSGRIMNLPFAGKAQSLAKIHSPPDQETRVGLGVSVVDVDSGETRSLTVFEPSTVFLNQFLPFFDQYALSHRLWSPDSKALVLPMRDAQDRDFIVVVPIDGSEQQPIAHGVAAFWSQQ